MILPSTRLSPTDHVFAREFDGELVLLDLNGGVYYGLDAVASHVWKAWCEGGGTLEEVTSDMLAKYDVDEVTLVKDIGALATDWVAKGLVEQVTG
jgi:hypothetical protein